MLMLMLMKINTTKSGVLKLPLTSLLAQIQFETLV